MNYIDIHTHKRSISDHIQIKVRDFSKGEMLTSKFDSIGVHPWSLPLKNRELVLTNFEEYIKINSPWMLGEIGLDRAIDFDFDEQKKLFKVQLELAIKYKIDVVVIHSVRAYSDVLELLLKSEYCGRVLLHDFNSNIQTADQFTRHFETYYSFGEKLFKSNTNAYKCFQKLPIEKVMLETDDSANLEISQVYQQAALILGMEPNTLAEQIQKNFTSMSDALFTDRAK